MYQPLNLNIDQDEGETHFTVCSELIFVATVTTGGRVKFVLAVYIFSENIAISRIICIELQDLHTPSVILHENCKMLHTQLNSNKKSIKITDFNAFTLFFFRKNRRNLSTFNV